MNQTKSEPQTQQVEQTEQLNIPERSAEDDAKNIGSAATKTAETVTLITTEDKQSSQLADEVSKEIDDEKVLALMEPSDAPIKQRNVKAERKKEEALLQVIAKETR